MTVLRSAVVRFQGLAFDSISKISDALVGHKGSRGKSTQVWLRPSTAALTRGLEVLADFSDAIPQPRHPRSGRQDTADWRRRRRLAPARRRRILCSTASRYSARARSGSGGAQYLETVTKDTADIHVCESSTPTAASTVCASAPARAAAAESGRRAHHAPTARNLPFPRRKDWLCLPKRALLSWPGRSSRGERLKGKEALSNPAAERRMAGSRWWRRVPP